MLNAVLKRLETLEQRHNQPVDGLGDFYSLSKAERERRISRMYGEREYSPEECERVYKEIMG